MAKSNLRAVPETPPRAVLYLRQSAFKEDSISLDLQETAGRDYCARMGYTVVAVEKDPGISGRTWKRPAVVRTMASIEDHAAEIVVLWRWSRLSRSRKDWALAVDRVEIAGGRIESATEPNDVTAAGRFARGVMTELSAFESERIGEQWKEVHVNRIGRGLQSGRLPWGWTHENRGAVANPDQAPAIPRLYDLYLAGMGARQLAVWLGENGYKTFYGKSVWTHSTVTAMLDSPFHSGQVSYHGELFAGAHEGLISAETFARYLAMRGERAGERSARHVYLMSGMMRCSCGGTMFGFSNLKGKRASHDYYGYRCSLAVAGSGHGPSNVSVKKIDPLIFEWLERAGGMADPAPDYAAAATKTEAQRFAREIIALDSQMSTLTQHLAQGIVPERAYRSAVEEMEHRRAALSAQLSAVESSIVLAPANPSKIAQELVDQWEWAPLQVKRATLRALVSSIVIDFGTPRQVVITPRGQDPVASDV